jgi:GNAT superfamily N-acetyltransferase
MNREQSSLNRCQRAEPPGVCDGTYYSVIDRQIARVGPLAFAKSWRRAAGRCVLLSRHYDIIPWLRPDWVLDTATGAFKRGSRRRPPKITLDIYRTDGAYWPLFEPHHYLKIPRMVACKYYVGFVAGHPVCHVATTPRLDIGAMRACRLVVMPEWQGAGLGVRFLNEVCRLTMAGESGFGDRVWRGVYFHTSHPGLVAALRRSPCWCQVSATLHGGNKANSAASIKKSALRNGNALLATGYGGHFRAVQGFLYTEGCRA